MIEKKARIIALYLPQFHRTEENDRYWGPGFTEWTNVAQARPLFRGHAQPNIPADLGFYDLRMPQVRAAQAELAREAGIEGFCYWHYWFGGGQETLSMPLDEVVRLREPDFPFCVGWANHDWTTQSWTRRKRRENGEYIFRQTYPGVEDEERHFARLLPCFSDRRYIRVDGKLLFLVFQPNLIPDASAWMRRWNRFAAEHGLGGFHFVGLGEPIPLLDRQTAFHPEAGINGVYDAIRKKGFDAVMSVNQKYAELKATGPARKIAHALFRRIRPGLILEKYRYPAIVRHYYTPADTREDVYPQLLAGWDRSPRSGRDAIIYYGRTPEAFELAIRDSLACVREKAPEHRIVFLNSWNEWGEGAYVEPDVAHGHAYLDAIRRAVSE